MSKVSTCPRSQQRLSWCPASGQTSKPHGKHQSRTMMNSCLRVTEWPWTTCFDIVGFSLPSAECRLVCILEYDCEWNKQLRSLKLSNPPQSLNSELILEQSLCRWGKGGEIFCTVVSNSQLHLYLQGAARYFHCKAILLLVYIWTITETS